MGPLFLGLIKWVAALISPYKWGYNPTSTTSRGPLCWICQEIWVLLLEKAVAKFCGSHWCGVFGRDFMEEIGWKGACRWFALGGGTGKMKPTSPIEVRGKLSCPHRWPSVLWLEHTKWALNMLHVLDDSQKEMICKPGKAPLHQMPAVHHQGCMLFTQLTHHFLSTFPSAEMPDILVVAPKYMVISLPTKGRFSRGAYLKTHGQDRSRCVKCCFFALKVFPLSNH